MWRIKIGRSTASLVVLTALGCCVALISARNASADSELDRLEAIWRQGDYARATQELIAYRERTGVRTPEIDYMIATSACRLPDRRQLGNEFFAWILQNYNLSPATRTRVESQRQLCSASAAPERLPVTAPAAMVGVAYHGKGGTNFDAQPSGDSRATVVAAVPPEQFAQRLFVPSDSQKAVRSVAKLIGPDFEIQAVGHFILPVPGPAPRGAPVSPQGILNAAAPPRGGGNSPNPSLNPDPDLDNLLKSKSSKAPPMPQTPNAPARAPAPNPPANRPTTQGARPSDMVQQMAPATSPSAGELKRVGESLEQYLQFFVSGVRHAAPTLPHHRVFCRRSEPASRSGPEASRHRPGSREHRLFVFGRSEHGRVGGRQSLRHVRPRAVSRDGPRQLWRHSAVSRRRHGRALRGFRIRARARGRREQLAGSPPAQILGGASGHQGPRADEPRRSG
jgi:hypothetical protein